jgi:acyl-coenzyme A synthetase/AMP-(fatty) acid ligase
VFVRKAGYDDLTEEKIVRIVSERLPARKHLLGGAYLVDKLPMNVNGKIQKQIVEKIAFSRSSLRTA